MQVSRVDKDMLLPPKVVLVLAPQATQQEEMCENVQFRNLVKSVVADLL